MLLYIFYIVPSQHGLVVKRRDPFYISPVVGRETLDLVTSMDDDSGIPTTTSMVKLEYDSNRNSSNLDPTDIS